ncbi:MAG: hypothetical protein ACPLRZ_01640 [Thermovenabulum sp.]|uniref:hypothetical protein n=1 Tax=Thermovenabulum sp. TaxID=3100335 RepID=UPI003C798270
MPSATTNSFANCSLVTFSSGWYFPSSIPFTIPNAASLITASFVFLSDTSDISLLMSTAGASFIVAAYAVLTFANGTTKTEPATKNRIVSKASNFFALFILTIH